MIPFDGIQKILVVAAHPDDEMLGCGGTLARFCQAGAEVRILLLGEGPLARQGADARQEHSASQAAAREAAAMLGITDVRFASLPDNRFDTVPLLEIIQYIEAAAADFGPELIFTHHAGDLNQDHRLTHQAVMTAFRPLPQTVPPAAILSFEVLSSTEYTPVQSGAAFVPNVYIDIAETLALKKELLQAYASEMRPWPHPRSYEGVEHLASLRGCQCGRVAAEAFMLCRGLW